MIIKVLAGLGIFFALFIIFVVIFLINKKTKIPDDCPKDLLEGGCASCMLSCSSREEELSLKKAFTSQSKKSDAEEEKTTEDENNSSEEENDKGD